MKRVAALLSSLLAAGTPALAAAGGAPYEFSLAKLLLVEGSVSEALETFQRAVELEPDDPYIRLEIADLLLRLSHSQPDSRLRQQQIGEAVRHIDRARELAPDNIDVLRSTGRAYMIFSDQDSDALPVALAALEGVREREPWDVQSMVALGQLYMARGEPARAAEVFAEAGRHTPNYRMLFNLLAESRQRAGQDREAEEALERVLALDPLDSESRVRLVELQGRRGDHSAALATLQAAPEEVRGEGRLRYLEARELFAADRPEEALAVVDELIAGGPDSRFRIFLGDLRARILERLERPEEAADELRTLFELAPDDGDLARQVAAHLAHQGRSAEAVAVLEGFLTDHQAGAETTPEMTQALVEIRFSLAAVHAAEKRWDEALAALAPLLESPDGATRVTGLINSAELLFQADRRGEALAMLEGGGDDPVIPGKRVELLLRSDDESRARRLLRSVVRGEDVAAALGAVQAFHREQRYRDTLPALEELAERHPSSPETYFLLGAATERVGETRRAEKAFLHLLEIDPDHAPTLNYLGYMWADHGENLERALGLVERAVNIDPHNGAYVDSLGWAHYRLGNFGEAREHLERAALLIPDDPVIHDHLGDVYAALGEPAKAAEQYRRALQVAMEEGAQDLDSEQVRRKLSRLAVE